MQQGIPDFKLSDLLRLRSPSDPGWNRTEWLLILRLPSTMAPEGALDKYAVLYCGGLFLDPARLPPDRPANIVLRRSQYLTKLTSQIEYARSVGNQTWVDALQWERTEWLSRDNQALRRIWRQIDPWLADAGARTERQAEHWLWRGDLDVRSAGIPSCNFMGSRQVPIHRLLWPVVRETHALFDEHGRTAYPRRNTKLCDVRLCVNPWHFEYATPVRHSDALMRGHSGSHSMMDMRLPAENHVWNIVHSDSRPDPDGVFERLVLCPHGHPFGPAAQIKYNKALKGHGRGYGTGYCPGCRKELRKSGLQLPKRGYKGQAQHEDISWLKDVPPAPLTPKPDLFLENDEPTFVKLDPVTGITPASPRSLTSEEREWLFADAQYEQDDPA